MTKKDLLKLSALLIKFQSMVAYDNAEVDEDDEMKWEDGSVEEIQNTISLVNEYLCGKLL